MVKGLYYLKFIYIILTLCKLHCKSPRLFSNSSGVDLLSGVLGDWLDDTSLF